LEKRFSGWYDMNKPESHTFFIPSLFILAILLSACAGPAAGEATPTPLPTPIVPQKPVYTVQRGTVIKTLEAQGRITPVQQAELFFRTDGLVQEVAVARGDAVKAGQVLARLGDPERFMAEVAAAQLSVEQASIELEALQRNAPLRAAEARLALVEAEQALQQALNQRAGLADGRTSDELTIEKARADYLTAEKALRKAQEAYEKVANRSETDPERVMALDALLDARQRRDQTQALLNWYTRSPAEAEMNQVDAEIALAEARYQLARETCEQLKAGTDPKELRLAQARLANAEAQLNLAQKSLEAVELRAPFDGQVLSIGIAPGTQVTGFQKVLTVAEPTRLELTFIPQAGALQELSGGQQVLIRLHRRPDEELKGSIMALPDFSEESSLNAVDPAVHVALEDADIELTLGELAAVTVELAQRENVLWIPPAGLRTFQGLDFAIIQDGELQRRVDVRLGLRSPERVEILDGLEEGQLVVGP
jgi:HlyD family secretion protein